MFYRYEIKNNGKEEILYLYLTMSYEFSKELGLKADDKELTRRTTNFIKNNSIDFNGNKVYLVIDGIVVKTLDLKKENPIEVLRMTNPKYDNKSLVTIKTEDQIVAQITLKDYLLGVLATNAISNLELTTLKALCVLYRTYAYKQMKEKEYINVSNQFQLYKPISYYKLLWSNNYQENYNKLEKAVNDTNCEFVSYEGEYILPFIHITNNTRTDTSFNYPYLEQRVSLWDYESPYYLEIKKYNYKELSTLLKVSSKDIKEMKITEISKNNHISKMKIGDKTFTGESFKNLLHLKSTDINIIINPTYIKVITKGWGNNLGLSQFGANEIAKVGCSYVDIIKYYFPKVTVKRYI